MQQFISSPTVTRRKIWGLIVLGVVVLSLIYSTQTALVNPNGLPQLQEFFAASLQPEMSREFLVLTGKATLTTLAYAVVGTSFSLILGMVFGLLTSQVWWETLYPKRRSPYLFWLGLRGLLAFPRAIHELIWGLFFLSVWGLDSLVAVWAIALPFGAIVAKVFSEILDQTPRSSLIALKNSGVAPLTAFIYTIIPQAWLNLLSYSFYRFECALRSAAVLGIIGAGGLGYQIYLSLQSLQYSQLWTLFYALIGLNGMVDYLSACLRRRLGCVSRLDLNQLRYSYRGVRGNNRQWWSLNLILLVGIVFCFHWIDPDWSLLWQERSRILIADIIQQAWPPQIEAADLSQLLPLALQTVVMSVMAIAWAGFGGVILAFLGANNIMLPGGLFNPYRGGGWIKYVSWGWFLLVRLVLLLCRGIPTPIWALVALYVLFPGILPGAVALAIHNLGILGRLMAEETENLPSPPLIALKAQGTPPASIFLYGILPLALPRFIAYIFYRWEVCMRETIVVGIVGAGGLGILIKEQISSFDYSGIMISLGCFLVLTFLVDLVSNQMTQQL